MLILAPFLAHASGIFSFISDSNELNKSNEIAMNSQTLPVLRAATNNDPNPAKGGGDILVVDDKAIKSVPTITGDLVEVYKPKSDQISVYVVREGDTLSQIANMFNVTSNTIRWANGFEGDIQPGQQLVILPVTGVKHTVKSGGTIADLAKMYNADITEIALFNGISVNTKLEPGMEILVPNGELHVEKKTSSKTKTTSKVASKSSAGKSTGSFKNPVPGAIKTQGIHGYNAVDFGASIGTAVYAAAGGQVIVSKFDGGWNGGYGNYIVIKHDNGTQTLYAHLSSVKVSQGSWVSQSDLIGAVGNTGKSTGPHLHFEVRGGTNPF